MKKAKAIAIIFLSLISLNGSLSSANISASVNSKFNDNIQLTSEDIAKYLESKGLTVESSIVQHGNSWFAFTSKDNVQYRSIVVAVSSNIIVHEDIRL
jgi:hypothetical protein